MSTDETSHDQPRSTFRRTLVRVLGVQAIALVLLWLLQLRYGG